MPASGDAHACSGGRAPAARQGHERSREQANRNGRPAEPARARSSGRRQSGCTKRYGGYCGTAGRAPSAFWQDGGDGKGRGRPAGQAAKLLEDRLLLLSKAPAPFVKTGEF
ncbi:hypothetical protein CY652_00010 [Burkholderia sp. WAC0059]|nr:hypothetical protein CY652_00010 [Burkholderia sp. WAC0059]